MTNIEIPHRAGSISIEAIILKTQLRWVGYVTCMDDQRLPKHLLFGELCSGRRKHFKDCVKANVAQAEKVKLQTESWCALTYQA